MDRILILEPYFGGSHKHFLEGLQAHVPADYTLLTLPARKWKMRMQMSAVWFIDLLKTLSIEKRRFDTVLLSTFVDAAVFRAMLYQVSGWNHQARIVTYFHENQCVYPLQPGQAESHQFTAINMHSALASDSIAFNSAYNRDTFINGCQAFQKKVADMDFSNLAKTLYGKSCILHPGIDFDVIDNTAWREGSRVPTIVWNHRWEHDKNPEEFFEALVDSFWASHSAVARTVSGRLNDSLERGLFITVLSKPMSAMQHCWASGILLFQLLGMNFSA